MGGVMSDEVLCCIDGTQDIPDLDLKDRERDEFARMKQRGKYV